MKTWMWVLIGLTIYLVGWYFSFVFCWARMLADPEYESFGRNGYYSKQTDFETFAVVSAILWPIAMPFIKATDAAKQKVVRDRARAAEAAKIEAEIAKELRLLP